ncbi:MAG: CRISPR-associated RAMP protein Csx10 [Candidatus Odinarchaeum yellowstonii]|uniref:CRISPR-associated RAMP protein Csx10 n=1 Tax=Odinarchaeota yellowstonii (strain LCB_4) TaxID=1841599 RepID=A0AAF0D255_ODILC|nr:MAG: CRISPR-associated RAMP protein Csx10 [Candidatus Odinarchaeum yellowstonii]
MSLSYISLKPETPLRLGGVKYKSQYLATEEFISGAIVRGTLAEYMILNGRKSEIKNLVKNIRFGFLYPSYHPDILSYPIPLTALTCKSDFGFKSNKGHGVFDQLIPLIAFKELEKQGAKFPVAFTFKCKECMGRMENINGYYIKDENYKIIRTERYTQTKTAINRIRKSAEEKMIYSVTAIKPKVYIENKPHDIFFNGKIYPESEIVDEVLKALNSIGIGSHTTRGYGKVSARRISVKEHEPLIKRIQSFNEKLSEVWSELLSIVKSDSLPKEPDATYFSVDLISPAILDDNGVPTLKLTIPVKGDKIEPILFSTKPVYLSGWSTSWTLPKPSTYGAAPGSTYVFKINKSLDDFTPVLERLEFEGIGKRRDEGYGEVKICSAFHMEVNQI